MKEHLESVDQTLGMMDEIAVVLAFALVGGFIATRLRLSPIVGYLAAGVALGPFTPGFVANQHLEEQLGEIGVVLLMFGVGLHFSVRDLMSVRNIAIPGAIGQSLAATGLALLAALAFGWSFGSGLVLGLAISVASTVVLIRALMDRNALETSSGKVAVGWLIVEDLFSVLLLILLPVLALSLGGTPGEQYSPYESMSTVLHWEGDSLLGLAFRNMGGTESILAVVMIGLANVALLGLLIFSFGRRFITWLVDRVDRTGSQELFTLSIVTLALFVAFTSKAVFGLSVALGAFVAGLVMGGARSHVIGEDIRPIRDLFGIIFFAAVGMLFDPATVVRMPFQVLTVLLIIMVGKPVAAAAIVLLLRQPLRTALTVAPALGQIGEFSFILALLGRRLGLLPDEAYQLVITGAIISILLNPALFRLSDKLSARWIKPGSPQSANSTEKDLKAEEIVRSPATEH